MPETPDSAEKAPATAETVATSNVDPNRLPFEKWRPILAGALAGIVLRFIFWGKPGGPYAAMMASFIYLCPIFVGAVTVYLAERKQRRTWGYYFWSGFAANVFFVFGTLLILIEGLICAIVIVPFFAFIGAFGGLIMGAVCRIAKWPKQTLYGISVLPIILGGIEGHLPTPSRFDAVERTIIIRASPEIIWNQIMDARDIQPGEMHKAWIFQIGVPLPLAGVIRETPDGPVRKITMGKNVHYDQIFTARQENRFVHWTYRLYADSFPPYALDDHVVVGGYYFDIKDTSYTLTPVAEGTELRIKMGYRVTTQFNWYTEPLARYMLGNFEEVVLGFYQRRSELQSVELSEHHK